jgi:SPP1 family predicted phage head-tail adaptor
MRAGTLRHKILIEQASETRDSFGGVVVTWGTFATMRVRQAIQGGKEFTTAQQRFSEISALFVGRFAAGVTAKMRVNHGGVYYDILAAYDPTGLRRETQIVCRIIV